MAAWLNNPAVGRVDSKRGILPNIVSAFNCLSLDLLSSANRTEPGTSLALPKSAHYCQSQLLFSMALPAAKVFPRFSFAIDRGGTFCDCIAEITTQSLSGEIRTKRQPVKLLSEDPQYVLMGRAPCCMQHLFIGSMQMPQLRPFGVSLRSTWA
jgi:hypothetical protein